MKYLQSAFETKDEENKRLKNYIDIYKENINNLQSDLISITHSYTAIEQQHRLCAII